jgi:hypothetical protein
MQKKALILAKFRVFRRFSQNCHLMTAFWHHLTMRTLWHLHPHLKDQGGGRQKGKRKQSNARSAEAANSGGSLGTPSGAQLQEMFAAFMLTQNAASAGPRRCNNRGPYHWTTEPKGMLRCPFDSKLLYL